MILPQTGLLGISLGKFDDYGAFLYLDGSFSSVTGYLGVAGGTGIPLFAERSASQLLTYTGTGHPPASFGFSGDWAISPTGFYNLYGPKPSTTGNWLTGVGQYLPLSVSGATGLAGATGPTGANGSGVPTSGASGHILVKSSSTPYATEWGDAVDVLAKTKKLECDSFIFDAGTIALKDQYGEELTGLGASITYNKVNNCFYITSSTLKYIYKYSASFKYLYSYDISSFIDGAPRGIEWIQNNEYLITTNDGVNSPKIHKITISDTSVTQVQVYNPILPVSLVLSGITYDKRNDKIYFCQQSSVSGSWKIYVTSGYSSLSSQSDFFDIEASELNLTYPGAVFEDICYNYENNSLVCFVNLDSGSIHSFEIDIKTGEPVTELSTSPSTPIYGLSSLATYIPASTGFCFRDNMNCLYAVYTESGAGGWLSILTKNGNSNIVLDFDRGGKNFIFSNRIYDPIQIRSYQSFDTATKPHSQIFNQFTATTYLGNKDINELEEGSEIINECFGTLSTYKTTSIFPQNYGEGGPPSSIRLNYLTGNYYLSLPSGLSDVPWKYTAQFSLRSFDTGTAQLRKSLYAHLEVFASSKLDLFYTETGLCSTTMNSPIDMSITFAPSGSGVINLYNQKITQR